jgi:hypothetical protein
MMAPASRASHDVGEDQVGDPIAARVDGSFVRASAGLAVRATANPSAATTALTNMTAFLILHTFL